MSAPVSSISSCCSSAASPVRTLVSEEVLQQFLQLRGVDAHSFARTPARLAALKALWDEYLAKKQTTGTTLDVLLHRIEHEPLEIDLKYVGREVLIRLICIFMQKWLDQLDTQTLSNPRAFRQVLEAGVKRFLRDISTKYGAEECNDVFFPQVQEWIAVSVAPIALLYVSHDQELILDLLSKTSILTFRISDFGSESYSWFPAYTAMRDELLTHQNLVRVHFEECLDCPKAVIREKFLKVTNDPAFIQRLLVRAPHLAQKILGLY